MAYEYFALIPPESNADLSTLKDNLELLYTSVENKPVIHLKEDCITITFDDFNFKIFFVNEDWVLVESIEMADNFETDWNEEIIDKEKLKVCASRFELSADDDFDMDYFNDSLYIIETIESFDGVIILPMG
ncbi:hypothetical protein [Flavobacterium reichenbachii]|uniref:Uncharacterized protein n=1 Tax=Flavobacterium reichenbachii TaxID=362418 RepID=A0A085ZF21_9FLAO|nr:hypothetical protein [Flavobacterium reichenbachii]KFF03035.1 hypothetical protein IW19_23165 [Flavobacterium reichenbachii]OXB17181.1 hypothetical protein B0A68_05135 [Flavobacterium reichenbachii]